MFKCVEFVWNLPNLTLYKYVTFIIYFFFLLLHILKLPDAIKPRLNNYFCFSG